MELNPYISGAITAFVYLTSDHFVSKKMKGWKRFTISLAITIIITVGIRFLFDIFAGNK